MRHNTQYLHKEELNLPVVMEGVDRIRGEETVVGLHKLSHVSSTQAIVNFLKSYFDNVQHFWYVTPLWSLSHRSRQVSWESHKLPPRSITCTWAPGNWNFAIIKIVIKPYLVLDSYILGEESFRDQMFYLFSLLRHIRVMEIASPCAIVADPTLRQGEACVFKSEREGVKGKS